MAEEDVAAFDIEVNDENDQVDNGLSIQDLSKLDVSKVTPLTPEVISRQATLNVGTIGHVAHGKSTLVRSLSNVTTQKFKDEARRNITIHLGYANAKVYKGVNPETGKAYYVSHSSNKPDNIKGNFGEDMTLVRHVSFVDCPGHDVLMATMLNGAAIMDAALLLIAANETFPQPQTIEHLRAVEIMQLKALVVVQNKIDLVTEATANAQKNDIQTYFSNTVNLTCPIIPISAQLKYGLEYLLEYICHIPIPTRRLQVPALMVVVRSFDVNKQGSIEHLKGGVAGGTVMAGILKRGQEVEVLPGIVTRVGNAFACRPIVTKIESMRAENNGLEYAIPGGLIATRTNLDPSLTRQNKLVGNLLGDRGTLPKVFSHIGIEYSLLSAMVASSATAVSKVVTKIGSLVDGEVLQVNIGTFITSAHVVQLHNPTGSKRRVELALEMPACCAIGEMVTISRRRDDNFRLIGWGRIFIGAEVDTQVI